MIIKHLANENNGERSFRRPCATTATRERCSRMVLGRCNPTRLGGLYCRQGWGLGASCARGATSASPVRLLRSISKVRRVLSQVAAPLPLLWLSAVCGWGGKRGNSCSFGTTTTAASLERAL